MNQGLVYVIDDNREFRESTTWMLEGAGYQVEDYEDPIIALHEIEQSYPSGQSCCLLDIRMPTMSGLEFHDRLKSRDMKIPIIYMSGHGDIPLAVEAMDKGAVTFLEKPLNNTLLKKALKKALESSSKFLANPISENNNPSHRVYLERYEKLTEREEEILKEIVAGKMNKVIAIDLGISIKTVELHRSRVMAKMKARNPADLVKMVITEQVPNE
jgi:FixJ family two-component response regulator